MTPREVVDSFVQSAVECLEALVESFEGTDRPTVWTGLFLRPRGGGDPVRSGTVSGVGTFKLHGRGCQFELDSGGVVDVDWDSEGRAVFDSWRILMYARSIGEDSVPQENLRRAAAATTAVTAVHHDVFTWPDRRFDLELGDA